MNAAPVSDIRSAPGAAADVAAFMRSVYNWMAIGLVLTGVIGALVSGNRELMITILRTPFLFPGLLIAELIMVVVFSRSVATVSYGTLMAMYVAYCALSGVTFSVYFLVYTHQSMAIALYITGGTFAAMSAYGTITKRDLSSWGNYLMMALFGIIIAMVVNMFLQSGPMMMVISAIAVVVFVGLTAYDTQKIRALAMSGDRRLALAGALVLYLDFVNLFIHLLRLFGRRR